MPYNLYITAQIRWLGLLLYLPDGPCSFLGTEKFLGASGIGLSASFGKEWFNQRETSGGGVGLQINYGYLPDTLTIHYVSLMLALTLTRF
jgi:hypothetical protein